MVRQHHGELRPAGHRQDSVPVSCLMNVDALLPLVGLLEVVLSVCTEGGPPGNVGILLLRLLFQGLEAAVAA